jgi:hypothetical protein
MKKANPLATNMNDKSCNAGSEPQAAQVPKTVKTKSFKEALVNSASPEAKLKVLLRTPIQEEQMTKEITSFSVTLPLTMKAQTSPTMAFKQAIITLTGHPALNVSLLNSCKAEIFCDSRVTQQMKDIFLAKGFCTTEVELTSQDIQRRARAYLHGYFRILRLAALSGFPPVVQQQVLDSALKQVSGIAKTPELLRLWRKNISSDRQRLEKEQSPNSSFPDGSTKYSCSRKQDDETDAPESLTQPQTSDPEVVDQMTE